MRCAWLIASCARCASQAGTEHLFGQCYTRTAHLFREVLQLRQSVLQPQRTFLVVHMHRGLKFEARDHRHEHVRELQRRVVVEQMAATGLAPFAEAHGRLVVGADIVRTLGHLHRIGLPQAERVDRARRPVAARLAMAIAHRGRLAAHREFDGAAEAASFVIGHIPPPPKNESISVVPRQGKPIHVRRMLSWRQSGAMRLAPRYALLRNALGTGLLRPSRTTGCQEVPHVGVRKLTPSYELIAPYACYRACWLGDDEPNHLISARIRLSAL